MNQSTALSEPSKPQEESTEGGPSKRVSWMLMILLVYGMLLAVGIIGSGFKTASGGAAGAERLFEFATNPFLGLIVGTMTTALVQSSSTVTSIIVGLVAGGLPVSVAIPMIMGANIGTTITNTIVSLGHVHEGGEFKRAFSAATMHDFFNLMLVIVFLPLEMAFGFLEKSSLWLGSMMAGGNPVSMSQFNFIKPITKPVVSGLGDLLGSLPSVAAGVIMIGIGIGLIFLSITFLGKVLKRLMIGNAKQMLHNAIGRGPILGIASGTAVTVLVQSSSTTTSLAVPLAGSGVLSVRQIYPFTLGANIGTCITALLAATAVTGDYAGFAMQIALVHLVYNLSGVVVVYSIPPIRELPIRAAEWLADHAAGNKFFAVGYIMTTFFLIPAVLLGASMLFSS